MRNLLWVFAGFLVGTAAAQEAPTTGESRYAGTIVRASPHRHSITVSVGTITRAGLPKIFLPTPALYKFTADHPVPAGPVGSAAKPVDPGQLTPGLIVWVYGTQPTDTSPGIIRKVEIAVTAAPEASRGAPIGFRRQTPLGLDDSAHISHDVVTVPMVFPVLGSVEWEDSFLAPRDGGKRPHLGQDLIAPKMRPLVAAFSGIVIPHRSPGHNWLTLKGDNGWTALYMHINIDTPGTRDEQGTDEYAFGPGIQKGAHVVAGQLIAFCGDSGNAREVGSHLHFELHDAKDVVYNAAASLRQAKHVEAPVSPALPTRLAAGPGEIRIDGFVYSTDSQHSQIVMDLAETTDPRGVTTVNIFPKRVTLDTAHMDLTRLPAGSPVLAIVPADEADGGTARTVMAFPSGVSQPLTPVTAPPPLPVVAPVAPGSASQPPSGDNGEAFPGPTPAGFDALTLSYWPILTQLAPTYNLDPALVASVIQRESSGDPMCLSSSGAVGLMQLMPENVQDYAVANPYDPEQNIRGGMAQLADYLKLFNGDLRKGLTAYNTGPGRVKNGTWDQTSEGRNYANKVLVLYASIRQTLGDSVAPAYEPPPVEPAPAPVTLPAPPPPKPLNPTIIAAPHADERTTDGRTIEMMLTTVNTSRELADEPALVQNGRLNYVADRIADDFAANSRPCNDAEAAKRLADHGDTELSDVRSICISTDTYAQFGNAWADAYRPGGNRLGMSHIESNGKHFWVILLAKE